MSAERKPEHVEGPAIVSPAHAKDRALTTAIGAELGYTRHTQLLLAYRADRLHDRAVLDEHLRQLDAKARFDAGCRYGDLYESAHFTGTNLLDPGRVRVVAASPGLPAGLDAAAELGNVNGWLSKRDRLILEAVCGCDEEPAAAIRRVDHGYRDRVSVRLREALSALVEAFEQILRHKRPRPRDEVSQNLCRCGRGPKRPHQGNCRECNKEAAQAFRDRLKKQK